MAAKTEASSPTKLSPAERLARKRAAARMRQQRCRARKRQAMLEQRRQQNEATQSPTHDSRNRLVHEAQTRPAVSIVSSPDKDAWKNRPGPNEPISNCVSFDSQRSYEEAQKAQERLPNATQTLERVDEADRQQAADSIGKKSGSPLVSEEEAAVAAMLSLKTGREPAASPSKLDAQPRVTDIRKPHMAKYRYYGSWEPRRYDAFEYRRVPPGVPEYYSRPRPPVPPMHYRYYPTFQRYGRFEYE